MFTHRIAPGRALIAAVCATLAITACQATEQERGSAESSASAGVLPSSAPSGEQARRIEDQIRSVAAAAGARVGVFAEPLGREQSEPSESSEPTESAESTVRVDDSIRFPMLSTFKVYAVAALLHRLGTGTELDRTVMIDAAAIVPNSPLTSAAVGTAMSLRDLCKAAITRSDNTAANAILRELGGPAAVTAFARTLGDTQTRLDRWEPELNSALPGDPRDTTTAAALGRGYGSILTGKALDESGTRAVTEWMQDSQTSSARMRASLPAGWYAADKTGSGEYGTTNDAGIVTSPNGGRYVLVVLSRDGADRADAPGFDPMVARITGLTTSLAGT